MTMSRCFSLATAALLVAIPFVCFSFAGEPAGPTAPPTVAERPTIAVLDLGQVLKGFAWAQAEDRKLKAEVDEAEKQVREEREYCYRLLEQLKQAKKGTPEYSSLVEEAEQWRQKLSMPQLRRDQPGPYESLQDRCARISLRVYREIVREVEAYAKANKIALVVRVSHQSADAVEPHQVPAFVMRDVVWHNGALDITPIILERLNAKWKAGDHASAEAPGK